MTDTIEDVLTAADRYLAERETARQAWIQGLRDLADWFEQHPNRLPEYHSVVVNLFAVDKADLAQYEAARDQLDIERAAKRAAA